MVRSKVDDGRGDTCESLISASLDVDRLRLTRCGVPPVSDCFVCTGVQDLSVVGVVTTFWCTADLVKPTLLEDAVRLSASSERVVTSEIR